MISRLVVALLLATSTALADIKCSDVQKLVLKKAELHGIKPPWSSENFGNSVDLERTPAAKFAVIESKANGPLPNLVSESQSLPKDRLSLSYVAPSILPGFETAFLYIAFKQKVDKKKEVYHGFLVPLVPVNTGTTNADLDYFFDNYLETSVKRIHMSFGWLEPLLATAVRMDDPPPRRDPYFVTRYLTDCVQVSADALWQYLEWSRELFKNPGHNAARIMIPAKKNALKKSLK